MNNEDLFRLENRLKRIEAAICAPPRLTYTMTEQALMPDDRIVEWVLVSAR